jgi:hypothetical protein
MDWFIVEWRGEEWLKCRTREADAGGGRVDVDGRDRRRVLEARKGTVAFGEVKVRASRPETKVEILWIMVFVGGMRIVQNRNRRLLKTFRLGCEDRSRKHY